jgi:magnesium-transporting ATPase (P-type)
MDEAALTGESDAVKKSSEKPIILSGSSVMEGEAVCLVIAVGVKSMRGSIAASLEQEVEVCRRLAPDLSVVAVTEVVCVVVAVLLFSACEHSSLHPDIVLLFLIVPCCC